jgi:hypothetical protein
MAYYGPKTVDAKGDTVYYSVPEAGFEFGNAFPCDVPTDTFTTRSMDCYTRDKQIYPSKDAFIVLFVQKENEPKLGGLLEYAKYKKEKLTTLKILLIKEWEQLHKADTLANTVNALLQTDSLFHLRYSSPDRNSFKALKEFYFVRKPGHVFDYFAVLVDKDHHIRGYYDPTYISEVKRMIEEYKHLVLKDEHAEMQEKNEIQKK